MHRSDSVELPAIAEHPPLFLLQAAAAARLPDRRLGVRSNQCDIGVDPCSKERASTEEYDEAAA